MKRLPLILMGLMLLLTACDGASRRGEALGREFVDAWGDTAAMHQTVKRFDALRNDSLTACAGHGRSRRLTVPLPLY